MNTAFSHLLQKELRLQRGNLMFAFGVTLLGIVGLKLIESSSDVVRSGFSSRDIQAALLLAVLMPVLVAILPAMIGSTAAAAERPLGVLAWQSALPVARWKIILSKCAVIAAACALVGGIFPVILKFAAMEPDSLEQMFRFLWPGWLAMMFAGIGFFAGSYAKDDYQGLLLSVIPAAVVWFAFTLADPFDRVFPLSVDASLSRPWAVILRLLAVAAFLVIIASRRHISIPTRRWAPMAGWLAVVLLAVFAVTLINVNVEADVLDAPENRDDVNGILRAQHPEANVARTHEIARTASGWFYRAGFDHPFHPRFLLNGRAVLFGSGSYRLAPNSPVFFKRPPVNRELRREHDMPTGIMIASDGVPRQLVQGGQVRAQKAQLVGLSQNQRWLRLTGLDANYIVGPYGLTVNLNLLPHPFADSLIRLCNFSYFTDAAFGWALDEQDIAPNSGDVVLQTGYAKNSVLVWKGGKAQIPAGTRPWLTGGIGATEVYLAMLAPDRITEKKRSTLTAVLRRGDKRGEVALAGFVAATPQAVSPDFRWARFGEKKGPLYRPIYVSAQEAIAADPLQDADRYSARQTSVEALDDGTTVSKISFFRDFPLVETTSGPATIEAYALVESVEVTTTAISGQIIYDNTFICRDIGAELIDLKSGNRTRVSMRIPGEKLAAVHADGINALAMQASAAAYSLRPVWDQPSQALAMQANGIMRFAEFGDYKSTGVPKLTISGNTESGRSGWGTGQFVAPHKFVQVEIDKIWLTEW